MSEHAPSTPKRPLSPHLQVYRLPLTALMSITHRFTGIVLAVGSLLATAFLLAAASGEEAYNLVVGLAASVPGQILLFLWSAALYYHMCNGVRHLIFDTGRLISKKGAATSNVIVLMAAAALTLSTWFCALNF